MAEREIYREEVYHANWFVWFIYASAVICYLVMFELTKQQLHLPAPFDAIFSSKIGLFVIVALLAYIDVIILRMMKLTVLVTDDQVYIERSFTQTPSVTVKLSDIASVDQQKSSGSLVNQSAGNRVVYSVIGSQTVTVTDTSGKNIVIGTHRPEELISAIRSVMK